MLEESVWHPTPGQCGRIYRLTDNFEIFGRIENALNKNYEEIHNYNTTGRAAYAGMRIRF